MADATVYTTTGKAQVVDNLDATSALFLEYMGWGTGTTTAVVGDSALESEVQSRTARIAYSQPSADTNQATFSMTADATRNIGNVGILTASSSGVLVLKRSFASAIALASGDSISVTATLQQT